MEVLLVVLTGVALVLLLAVVLAGVHVITEELKRTNEHLAKIYWGVRAIEKEADAIPAQVPPLIETFAAIEQGSGVIAERLTSAERRLAAAGELLGASPAGPQGRMP
jgi:hypothetical protein